MATRQYIGARYVPKFYENSDGTAAWRSGVIYEPLTIVTYNGNSYTSKKVVPATIGDPSSNPAYWAATGVYNEQLESIRQELENYQAETAEAFRNTIRTISGRRFVIIGDSYAAGWTSDGDVRGWGDVFADYLGIAAEDYEVVSLGGAGFCANYRGKNFSQLLADSAISDPETVTDVIAEGGYNDVGFTPEEFYNAISAFVGAVKIKYPNAKVWIGHNGWAKNGEKLYAFSGIIRSYIEAANQVGAAYIANVEYALHSYFDMFASDGYHPNQVGQNSIARVTADNIIGGSGDIHMFYRGFNVDAAEGTINNFRNAGTVMTNGTVSVMNQNDMTINFTTPLDSYMANGKTLIDIGTISSGYIIGSDYGFCTFSCAGAIYTEGKYEKCDVILTIKGGHVYLSLRELNAAGNNWRMYRNITEITFSRFYATFDATLC